DSGVFVAEVRSLAAGSPLQRRAAVAAVADPPLLRDPAIAAAALEVLDDATEGLRQASDHRADDVRALRKGLGYAWSVVIVATPEDGKRRFEALADESDSDIAWVVRENLKKARLERMDPEWVARMRDGSA
ncbi:MAG: HEAT repeat domain-containing protein, partial [Coriobacteriales bacterium]|nr:HEAT repeat domain-containing protein [Coriobacteriales bacterium]